MNGFVRALWKGTLHLFFHPALSVRAWRTFVPLQKCIKKIKNCGFFGEATRDGNNFIFFKCTWTLLHRKKIYINKFVTDHALLLTDGKEADAAGFDGCVCPSRDSGDKVVTRVGLLPAGTPHTAHRGDFTIRSEKAQLWFLSGRGKCYHSTLIKECVIFSTPVFIRREEESLFVLTMCYVVTQHMLISTETERERKVLPWVKMTHSNSSWTLNSSRKLLIMLSEQHKGCWFLCAKFHRKEKNCFNRVVQTTQECLS